MPSAILDQNVEGIAKETYLGDCHLEGKVLNDLARIVGERGFQ